MVDNRRRRELVVDARIEARAELLLSGAWFVRATAGAWIPLIRPGFSYETNTGSLESLHELSIVAGVAQIGVGVRFR